MLAYLNITWSWLFLNRDCKKKKRLLPHKATPIDLESETHKVAIILGDLQTFMTLFLPSFGYFPKETSNFSFPFFSFELDQNCSGTNGNPSIHLNSLSSRSFSSITISFCTTSFHPFLCFYLMSFFYSCLVLFSYPSFIFCILYVVFFLHICLMC